MAENPLGHEINTATDEEMLSFLAGFYPATNPDKLSESIIISKSQERVDLTMARFAKFWVNGNQDDLLSLLPTFRTYLRNHLILFIQSR
jgi:hypothetical protein